MSARKDQADPLLTQVSRLSRLLQRLKNCTPSPSHDRSANILLLVIHREGPLRVADLAGACYLDASTVSRQAAELVGDGLLRREADPVDGRASLLALTGAGQRQVAELMRRRREFFEHVVADWDAPDLDAFLALLTRFVDDVEARVSAVEASPQKVQA